MRPLLRPSSWLHRHHGEPREDSESRLEIVTKEWHMERSKLGKIQGTGRKKKRVFFFFAEGHCLNMEI